MEAIKMGDFAADFLGNAIVVMIGIAVIGLLIKKYAYLAGKKTDSVLAKLFGEKRAEKIEEKLIETGLKRFLEGLDADEES